MTSAEVVRLYIYDKLRCTIKHNSLEVKDTEESICVQMKHITNGGNLEMILTSVKAPVTVPSLTVSDDWLKKRSIVDDNNNNNNVIATNQTRGYYTKTNELTVKLWFPNITGICLFDNSELIFAHETLKDELVLELKGESKAGFDKTVYKTLSITCSDRSVVCGRSSIKNLSLQARDHAGCSGMCVTDELTGKLDMFSSAKIWLKNGVEDKLVASGFSEKLIRAINKTARSNKAGTDNGISNGIRGRKRKTELDRDDQPTGTEVATDCKICYSNVVSTINLPCGHVVCCFACAKTQQKSTQQVKCAMCKKVVTKVQPLYL
jgi:hypothetical protein